MSMSPMPAVLLTDHDSADYRALLQHQNNGIVVRTLEDGAALRAECDVWLGAPEGVIDQLREGLLPRWVQLTWAGIAPMLDPTLPRGFQLTRASGVFGAPMLEYLLHHMLAHAWQSADYPAAQSRFCWRPASTGRLSGKCVVVVGLGSIGLHIARALAALGMHVKGVQRVPRQVAGIERVGSMDALLEFASSADYVINVLPDTPATRDLYDSRFFAAMSGSGVFINIGRGSAVVDQALIDALGQEQIAAAVLDVFRKEPLPPSHQFWVTPNLTLTPHIAGPTNTAAMIEFFLNNLSNYQAGQSLEGLVDLEQGY
ncbi:NAD(P)-dependent oxidoreductase [Pseudomonas sp. NPDC008258]|uniref:D-2-hydroxyacid dehydrogenase n=1 Tax=Pseudomonas sp. NPDC008258 TaxID=3364418 RepID=UPI0036EBBA64